MTKDEHVRVYMTRQTKQRIKQEAKSEGLSPSVWMRHIAKKQLPQEVEA